jgi:hypothetical protein
MKHTLKAFYWIPSAHGGETPGQPAWHVDVAVQAESMDEVQQLGGKLEVDAQINMAQAAELGFTLEAIGEAFATDAAATADLLRAQLAEKDAALASAATSAAADGERLAKALAGLQARVDAMTAEAAANLQAWQTAIAERDAALQVAAENEQALRAEIEAAKAAVQ